MVASSLHLASLGSAAGGGPPARNGQRRRRDEVGSRRRLRRDRRRAARGGGPSIAARRRLYTRPRLGSRLRGRVAGGGWRCGAAGGGRWTPVLRSPAVARAARRGAHRSPLVDMGDSSMASLPSAATLANVGCRMEHWVVARSEQSHAASTCRQRPPWPRRRRRRLAHSTREPRMQCRRMERRVLCLASRTGCAAAATTCA
mmetsp:Transcript_22455/g.72323  ORF Transcript_22455/g.72323 Transcript_22455/m.72323 type:complete len:201 (-) Transcript_22455:290-892(-)